MNLPAWLIGVASVLVAACGGPPPGEAAPEESRVLRDYAERPLEKARGIEDPNLQRKGEIDDQIDESTR